MINGKNGDIISKFGVPVILFVLILVIHLTNTGLGVLGWSNLRNVAVQSTVLGLAAMGLSLVMISGEMDLSIGGSIGLVGAFFAGLLAGGLGAPWAALLAIVLAVLFSAFNGLLVSKWGYSSFMITVSTMFIGMGIQRAYTNGLTIWVNDDSVLTLVAREYFGIPLPVIFLLLVFLIYFIVINSTKAGFQVRVVGENIAAAKEEGINTKRVQLLAFAAAGFFYGSASIIETIRISGAIIYSGQSVLLPAWAACFLGTTMFIPGRVNVLGTLTSAVFLILIMNVLTLLGVRFYYVPLIQGFILLVAVSLSTVKHQVIQQVKIQ
ncbi:MAG: ABC transporter permease [Bacillota bacterium]